LRLNQSPHLRHLFFSAGGFSTLDVAEDDLKTAYATVGWPRFVGRARERAAIEEFLNDPAARLMQVIGPRYVGKTRLVLEALKNYGARVLWSSRAEALSLDHFRDLDTSEEGTILVIDSCEPSSTRRILEAAAGRRQLKTIVIREGGLSDAGPAKLALGPLEHSEMGLIRCRGRFVEVIPPRLADHLAAHALRVVPRRQRTRD
jgi:hypothetical protein